MAVAAASSATAAPTSKDDLVFFVFKKHCFKQLVEDHQIPDTACLKFTLSKTLGYGIVTGVLLVLATETGEHSNSIFLQVLLSSKFRKL